MSAANGPTKVEKYGYVYDGSSDWTIGENPDPQAHPMANVWSKNDVAALERCKIIADAFNVYAETGLTPREMMEERGRERDYWLKLLGVGEKHRNHWWCSECKKVVDPECVTFEEAHVDCGTYVEWIDQCKIIAALSPERREKC